MDEGKYAGKVVERNGLRYIEMSGDNLEGMRREAQAVRDDISFGKFTGFRTIYDNSRRILRPKRRIRFRRRPYRAVKFNAA